MIPTKENFVLKHTAAVHINNKLSLLERKIFNILTKNIKSQKDSGDLQSIHIKQLSSWLGAEEYTNYEFLKEGLHNLVKTSLRFNILNKDRKKKWESSVALLAEVHFDGGMIYYVISPSLKEALSKPSSYAYLNIKFQNLLSSRHSLALWEYCCEQLDSSKVKNAITPYITIESLKLLLGVEGQGYELYKVFNSKVIKKSIKEINAKTDIQISSILTRKNGKKIVSIAFNISRLNTVQLSLGEDTIISNELEGQLDLIEPDILTVINKTFEKQDIEYQAYEIGLNKTDFEKFLKKYSLEEVKKAVLCVKNRPKNSVEIKNIGAYIWKILDQGIIDVEVAQEELQRKKHLNFVDEAKIKFQNIDAKIRPFFEIFSKHYEGDFVHWIAKIDFVSYEDGLIVFKTSSPFFKDWIINNLHSKIINCGKTADEEFKGYEILLEKQ